MNKEALVEAACQDLLTYGVWNGKSRMKYLVKKYLLRHRAAPEDLVSWPTGLLAAGLWQCRQEIKAEEAGKADAALIDLVLEAYYDRWLKKKCPIIWLDDLLAGETLLEIYEDYRQNRQGSGSVDEKTMDAYRQAIEKLAVYGLEYPTDETGSFPYRAEQNKELVFVDSIGLACPFLYRYGVLYGRQETMELAVKQIVNFLAYGMDVATGLPYHGYSVAQDCKYGIIGWGRAVGWLHDDGIWQAPSGGILWEGCGCGACFPKKGWQFRLAASGNGRSGRHFRGRHDLCRVETGNRIGHSAGSKVRGSSAEWQECHREVDQKWQSVPVPGRMRGTGAVSPAL